MRFDDLSGMRSRAASSMNLSHMKIAQPKSSVTASASSNTAALPSMANNLNQSKSGNARRLDRIG